MRGMSEGRSVVVGGVGVGGGVEGGKTKMKLQWRRRGYVIVEP